MICQHRLYKNNEKLKYFDYVDKENPGKFKSKT